MDWTVLYSRKYLVTPCIVFKGRMILNNGLGSTVLKEVFSYTLYSV